MRNMPNTMMPNIIDACDRSVGYRAGRAHLFPFLAAPPDQAVRGAHRRGCRCGDGFYIASLPGHVKAIGFDVSDAGFAQNRKADSLPCLVRADARKLPLNDGVADVVLLLDVIEHVREDRACCRK